MAFDFKFPDVGEGITEGEVVKIKVKEGDLIKEDDVLAEVETDKAVVEIPSPKSGRILKLFIKEGEKIKVGSVMATIGEASEIAASRPALQNEEPEDIPRKKSTSVVGDIPDEEIEIHEPIPTSNKTVVERPRATLMVKKLAKDLSLDIAAIKGTGPEGRILEEDVRKAAEPKKDQLQAAEKAPALKVVKKYDLYGYVDRIPLRGVRKSIADHMVEARNNVVPVTHFDEVVIDHLSEIKSKEQERVKVKLTLLPFIVKAVIQTLHLHPVLNSTLNETEQEIIVKKYYNIGIAVDTPDGLIVPVIKIADSKTIHQLAEEIFNFANLAKERKINLGDLKGGTFTITNVGGIGGIHFTPIINYPEAAILGLGRAYEKAIVEEGKVLVKRVLPFSLTFDHRIIDGAEAARFANDLKKFIQDPDALLLESK
ncbi:2-oxo acid dehydrogenase subunit E2 [Candidatus Woesearchaeota archaeon]|nr:2-oxo acid dehydrogenase subunit E2 [Candidatus Woesearchaeota archaeon]